MSAGLSSETSPLFGEGNSVSINNHSETTTEHNATHYGSKKKVSMLLKLIGGSLIGIGNWIDLLSDSKYEHTPGAPDASRVIPTMEDVFKYKQDKNDTELDNKQKITHEITCSTFLLGLINERMSRSGDNGEEEMQITAGVEDALTDYVCKTMHDTTRHLRAKGGAEQLLVFLTRPASAGKSTTVKAAESFCFNLFCACDMHWTNLT